MDELKTRRSNRLQVNSQLDWLKRDHASEWNPGKCFTGAVYSSRRDDHQAERTQAKAELREAVKMILTEETIDEIADAVIEAINSQEYKPLQALHFDGSYRKSR